MLRPWDLTLTVDRAAATSLFLQITDGIADAIRRGRLKPGMALPGSRDLAAHLGVNRKTVVLAYEELAAQGWLAAEGKRGTFVSPNLPDILESPPPHPPAHRPEPAPVPAGTGGTVHGAPGTIAFRDGVPDARLIPFDILSRAFRHALVASARANRLSYDDPRGTPALRHALSAMLTAERGLTVGPDEICAVRGSQMGIFLAARVLVRPGDPVVVERLSYPPARQALLSCGATILDVGQDEHGLKVDELEALCRRHPVRLVYTTPHHQYPTTVMLSAERRMRLSMLAGIHGFHIVEDDYDHEFHFSRRPMLPLASADPQRRVIYVGSLSKILAPGLRVGYVAAGAEFIARCAAEVMLIDRQGNAVTELAVAELMQNGALKRHIRRCLTVYRERRDRLADRLAQDFGDRVRFSIPEGGLAFWLEFPGLDMDTLCRCAVAERVKVLPARLFSATPAAPPAVRLGFGDLDERELDTGLDRLRRALGRAERGS